MKLNIIIDKLSNLLGRGRVFKLLFNVSPMYRRTGGRLLEVSNDLMYVKIKLALNYKTKNYVGTIYGGHMYSCVDGIYMVQLINILGGAYVVWDRAASIRFRRPGDQTLFAEFSITPELVEHIKSEVRSEQEKDFTLRVDLVDGEGCIYAEVTKVVYIANKAYYRSKRS